MMMRMNECRRNDDFKEKGVQKDDDGRKEEFKR